MTTLNKASISSLPSNIEKASYDRSQLKAGIAHIGVGAFHRAHQAIYLDKTIEATGDLNWGLVGIGLLPFDAPMRDAMEAQDGLYTVTEMTPKGERIAKLIQCMTEYLYAPGNHAAVVERLTDPNIKIVSLTVTEGGYLMDTRGQFQVSHPSVVQDLANPTNPQSTFGILVEALHRRRNNSQKAFTIMSCDNLRHNGDQARNATVSYARARDAALAAWIEENVTFPNGMVDRITPATTPEWREKLKGFNGVEDKAPVICEDFIQWVLEDKFCNGRPDFAKSGVTMTDNVTPYEEAKIRLLNGSHQMLSYPAFLSGLKKVDVSLGDSLFHSYLENFLNEDSGPFLSDIPGMELSSYKKILIQRFGNQAIGDQLARLCLDGGSKIPGFLLPTLKANLEKYGRCPRMSYLLACYNRYIHNLKDDNGEEFELREPNAMSILQPIIDSKDPMTLIQCNDLLGDSAQYPEFVKEYLTLHEEILKNGARKTLENLNSIAPATH
jgi:mannitol 2-dehydrogenase